MREKRGLVGFLDAVNGFFDLRGRGFYLGDFDNRGISQKRISEAANFGGHGGGEKERLPLGRKLGDDSADRLDKTHVKHAVGFVEDQNFDGGQVDVALFHEIHQSAGRGDDDVQAAMQGLDLVVLVDAAKDCGQAKMQGFSVGGKAFGDLGGKFARGAEDEAARALAGGAGGGCQAMEYRRGEGGGFAGAGLGAAENVLTGQHMGNGLGLDGRGGGVTLGANSLENRSGKMEIRE